MSVSIAVVLPRKDEFSIDRTGAVALTVEQYVRHSGLCGITRILGVPVAKPRLATAFMPVAPADRWWRGGNHAFAVACATALQQARPRHIDVHNRVEVFEFLTRQCPGSALTLWFHNDPQGMAGSRTAAERQRILQSAYRIICVSNWVRERFLEGVCGPRERVLVFPNAVEMGSYPSTPKRPLILFVGRIIPEKGALEFVQALPAVLAALPGWSARLIGDTHPSAEAYGAAVHAAGRECGERLTISGYRPHHEVMQAFREAAVVVVPSLWEEPFARTALEAMTSACAVIASRRGGLAEVVGEAGILLDEPTPARLAEAMTVLGSDAGRRRELQQRALWRARHSYDIRAWSEQLDTLRLAIDPTLAGFLPAPVRAVDRSLPRHRAIGETVDAGDGQR